MSALAQAIPEHVPDERVFEFDYYALDDDAGLRAAPQANINRLVRQAPDLFFTPANGGHWVVTRYELMRVILTDHGRFSVKQLAVPRNEQDANVIPLSLDPPEHTPYRQVLMRHFSPKPIQAMESAIRAKARELIEAVADKGACDFAQEVAIPLPVLVFMEMMGLPEEKYGLFRSIVVEYFSVPNGPRRFELMEQVMGHLREVIEARRLDPRGDLVSKLLEEKVDGGPIGEAELESMAFLLFLAGLDTVANAAGFTVHQLATKPQLQARLAADPSAIPAFVDECLRVCGVVMTVRLVTQDTELDGQALKAGDLVMLPLALAGFDEHENSAPERFDMDRSGSKHLMFGTGPHLCAGQILGRLELRVLLEEWLKRVPRFGLAPGAAPDFRIASILSVHHLDLVW